MKGFLGTVIFIFGLLVGFLYVDCSWHGERFVSLMNISENPNREIAAVRKMLDVSQYDGLMFSSLSSHKLITNAQIALEDQHVLITLGHYVLKTKEGKLFLACQMYDKVLLKYVAEGVASNGTPPLMEITGDCNILNNDVNHIATIKLPAKQILSQQPGDGDINFHENYNLTVNFKNISNSWPKQWALQSVTLVDTKKNQFDAEVEPKKIPLTLSKNLNMDWNNL